MKRIAILMLVLLMPLAAFAGTKELTCTGVGFTTQIVLDEDASTVLVSHPNENFTEPLATATFTHDMVTWTYDDGNNDDNAHTYNYKLNRMTGSLSIESVSKGKIDHDNYGNRRRRVQYSTMSCEISHPKF
jgi:hypothetical protein